MLGLLLRRCRLQRKLTAAKVAARIGVPRPVYSRIEAGRHTPTVDTLVRLQPVLGFGAQEVGTCCDLGWWIEQRRL